MYVDLSQARFQRLRALYADPMTEVYLMFYETSLQIFVHFNKFLQREDPIIFVVLDQMRSFFKKLLGKFVKVAIIKAAERDLTTVMFEDPENQLSSKLK